jgi:RNA-binding protein
MPSTPLRRHLRGLGHALAPVVQIGKQGAIVAVFKQVSQALLDHELIKVKLGSECPETRFELAERFGAEPGVNVVQILGRTLLLYKRHPQKPKLENTSPGSEGKHKPARDRRRPAGRKPAGRKPAEGRRKTAESGHKPAARNRGRS